MAQQRHAFMDRRQLRLGRRDGRRGLLQCHPGIEPGFHTLAAQFEDQPALIQLSLGNRLLLERQL